MNETDTSASNRGEGYSPLKVRKARHPGWWIVSVLVGGVLASVVWALVTTPNISWAVAGEYLFSPQILAGIEMSLLLTLVCLLLGTLLGLAIALMRLSPLRIPAAIASGFIWLFRGVPVLVQLIFWFNLGLLFPRIGIAIPFSEFFVGLPTNELMSAFAAAVIGLSLNEAAYMAEIIRAGIRSVDSGQIDAAKAVGMAPAATLLRVVLPQAIRVIIPPTGNEIIMLLKGTSLVAVIGVTDLLNSARHIYAVNLRTMELLFVASFWYLVLVNVLSVLQMFLERHFGRGYRGSVQRGRKSTVQPSPLGDLNG